MTPYPPPARSSNPAPWIAIAAVLALGAGGIGFAVGRGSAPTSAPVTRTVTDVQRETETVRREPAVTSTPSASGVASGTHVVGRNIEPGSYRTAGPVEGDVCYWGRLSDTSGTRDSVIAADVVDGATTVTVEPGDGAFKTSGCQPWVKVG